jgi:hypothetical protein
MEQHDHELVKNPKAHRRGTKDAEIAKKLKVVIIFPASNLCDLSGLAVRLGRLFTTSDRLLFSPDSHSVRI